MRPFAESVREVSRMDYGSMIGAFIGGAFIPGEDGKIRNSSGKVVGSFDATGVMNPKGRRMECADITTIHLGGGAIELKSHDGSSMTLGSVGDYHIEQEGELRAPSCLIEVVGTMQVLYPTIGKHVFFEEIACKEMMDMSMMGRPDLGLIEITDKDMLMFHADFQARMKTAGFKGRLPGKQLTMDAIEVLTNPTDGRSRNLFREWLEGLKWDGIPRMRDWFVRTLGVTAPALSSVPEAEAEYIEKVTETWMVGAVLRQYQTIKHEIVPVLIGMQGAGKGNLLKFMAGDDKWFASTNESISDKKKFMESIAGRVIVELGEAVQLQTSDAESLKSFISQEEDSYRMSYGRRSSTFPRHFVLVATSNLDTVFNDPTGNRRYFPLYCDETRITFRIDHEYSADRTKGQHEVEQLWAEAYHKAMVEKVKWYREGDFKFLSEIMQEYAAIENQSVSVINRYLDDPYNGYDKIGAKVTRETVLQAVFGVDTNILVPRDVESAWREWTYSQSSWVRRNSPGKINGKSARIFERVKEPQNFAMKFLQEYKAKLDAFSRGVTLDEFSSEDMAEEKVEPTPVKVRKPQTVKGLSRCKILLMNIYLEKGWNFQDYNLHIPSDELDGEDIEEMLEEGLAIRAQDGGVITVWCPAYGNNW